MSLPVLTAGGDPRWEAELTAALGIGDHGVEVVRRCVDVADLLAAAAAGLARAVVVSADLRRFDGAAVARLHAAGVAVIGVAADSAGQARLHQIGSDRVLATGASAGEVAAALRDALLDPPARTGDTEPGGPTAPLGGGGDPIGEVVAVWGPTGAPGRTTIAVNIAAELAARGHRVTVVDADTYGAAVGQVLGLLDEAPGVAAACRQANHGTLDAVALTELAAEVAPGLRVLTGVTRVDRWPEIRPAALATVLELCRRDAAYVVVDCGFCLEQDEELAYDTAAPRRNGASIAALEAAHAVVMVTGSDPLGLARFVRAGEHCRGLAGTARVIPVANRLRRGVVGAGDPRRAVSTALERYAGLTSVHIVPEDRAACDAALAAGRTLAEAAPRSPARAAIAELAVAITGVTPGRARRRQGRDR